MAVKPKTGSVHTEILTGLESVKLRPNRRHGNTEQGVEQIGRHRIEAIVSSQKHPGAYDRAARVLAGLAKYYILANEKDKARSLLHEFLFVKFPRHNAFRREVKSVASGSALIQELRVI